MMILVISMFLLGAIIFSLSDQGGVARTYVCKNECKPKVLTEPMTNTPKCHRCGKKMIVGSDE